MDIIPFRLNEYMNELLPERHAKFYEMEEYALQRKFPIVGAQSANFMAQQAASIGAKRIMELGSGFGYSALWFSTILPEDGKIICTDDYDENKKRAEGMFEELGLSHMLDYRLGNALEIFAEIDEEFDFIFCDIGKKDYPQAFDMAAPKVRKGGFLAFDNCLWSGRVVEGDESDSTKGVLEVNNKAFTSPDFHVSLIPIRDGILLCRKL